MRFKVESRELLDIIKKNIKWEVYLSYKESDKTARVNTVDMLKLFDEHQISLKITKVMGVPCIMTAGVGA